jgi:hypothetical protein
MLGDGRMREAGSVLVTNGSGCGSGRPKNIPTDPTDPDPNAEPDPQHFYKLKIS